MTPSQFAISELQAFDFFRAAIQLQEAGNELQKAYALASHGRKNAAQHNYDWAIDALSKGVNVLGYELTKKEKPATEQLTVFQTHSGVAPSFNSNAATQGCSNVFPS